MEHSVNAYLERMAVEKLEKFLNNCNKNNQEQQYAHVIPLVKRILSEKKKGPWR